MEDPVAREERRLKRALERAQQGETQKVVPITLPKPDPGLPPPPSSSFTSAPSNSNDNSNDDNLNGDKTKELKRGQSSGSIPEVKRKTHAKHAELKRGDSYTPGTNTTTQQRPVFDAVGQQQSQQADESEWDKRVEEAKQQHRQRTRKWDLESFLKTGQIGESYDPVVEYYEEETVVTTATSPPSTQKKKTKKTTKKTKKTTKKPKSSATQSAGEIEDSLGELSDLASKISKSNSSSSGNSKKKPVPTLKRRLSEEVLSHSQEIDTLLNMSFKTGPSGNSSDTYSASFDSELTTPRTSSKLFSTAQYGSGPVQTRRKKKTDSGSVPTSLRSSEDSVQTKGADSDVSADSKPAVHASSSSTASDAADVPKDDGDFKDIQASLNSLNFLIDDLASSSDTIAEERQKQERAAVEEKRRKQREEEDAVKARQAAAILAEREELERSLQRMDREREAEMRNLQAAVDAASRGEGWGSSTTSSTSSTSKHTTGSTSTSTSTSGSDLGLSGFATNKDRSALEQDREKAKVEIARATKQALLHMDALIAGVGAAAGLVETFRRVEDALRSALHPGLVLPSAYLKAVQAAHHIIRLASQMLGVAAEGPTAHRAELEKFKNQIRSELVTLLKEVVDTPLIPASQSPSFSSNPSSTTSATTNVSTTTTSTSPLTSPRAPGSIHEFRGSSSRLGTEAISLLGAPVVDTLAIGKLLATMAANTTRAHSAISQCSQRSQQALAEATEKLAANVTQLLKEHDASAVDLKTKTRVMQAFGTWLSAVTDLA
eukprot:TRINITY_DN1948_c0_g1_i2.p1 TRINITY_DN1948_c0_g1~~TRINITY_DN1948_c0_g1_i2.p1  ORF type:complete len:774 (-),score=203.43 TRINITY_DN1948_c0_g1_i2:18-2339(-)